MLEYPTCLLKQEQFLYLPLSLFFMFYVVVAVVAVTVEAELTVGKTVAVQLE